MQLLRQILPRSKKPLMVREAVPEEIPVLLNTGAKAETIVRYLEHADGCIVGSDLKVDGYTWNPVDRDRAKRFVETARSA